MPILIWNFTPIHWPFVFPIPPMESATPCLSNEMATMLKKSNRLISV